MNNLTIQPDYRQFLSETMPLFIFGLVGMAAFPFIQHTMYVTYAYAAVYALLIILLFTKYAVIRAYSWTITNVKICQKQGIITKQTDYIELYRVVDYRETQTFVQQIFGIKTVIIISTDKSDTSMLIKGVDDKSELVNFIRNLVEKQKKENHVYEIANR